MDGKRPELIDNNHFYGDDYCDQCGEYGPVIIEHRQYKDIDGVVFWSELPGLCFNCSNR